ncbi:MAG: putative DNA binding domain-containing protein [Patescibacteria group bacterium]|nr:putative DNA binding domain-containing protein [Patescibacteria group bacterium]
MRRIIIKEGPLVFLRDVLIMETLAAIFLYSISFLANYEMLYQSWGLTKIIRYQIFLILGFSLFQLIYVSLLFLNWYFSHYEITEKEIVKKFGLFFRHKKAVSLTNVVSVEIYQSLLSKLMNHATITIVHGNNRVTKIKNANNVDEYVHIIKQLAHNSLTRSSTNKNILSLIKDGESSFMEFKQTMRFDIRKKEVSKEIEHTILKTIVSFLNTNGGILIIGVNDEGEVVGLEDDYKTLPKKNRDGFENHLNTLVKTMIGLPFTKYVDVKFEKVKNFEVCVISIRESHKPAYLRNSDKKEEFFVRVGNSTQPFSMSEAEEYIKTHWK